MPERAGRCGRTRSLPQEPTSPPARSIASHNGSADRTKSSAVAASTSSTAHTSATISRQESAGRSASVSRSTVKRYAVLLHPSSSAATVHASPDRHTRHHWPARPQLTEQTVGLHFHASSRLGANALFWPRTGSSAGGNRLGVPDQRGRLPQRCVLPHHRPTDHHQSG
jgi:hypothetical protein